ncbi:MAG: sodium-dependent transporter [Marinobacter sp.]|nr:sodium-dependent transporter [Marinobacter sp.]
MPRPYQTSIGSWTSRSTFFWAATGATVGLSNFWRFPYLLAEHGGAAFLLLYLGCLFLITLPLMLTETAIGRTQRHGVVLAMDGIVRQNKVPRYWLWSGRLSIVSSFLVLSFYAVIGAICLAYVFFSALGHFKGAGTLDIALTLGNLVEEPAHYRRFMGWHAVFLVLMVVVAMQGIVNGLERALRLVMPLLLCLLAGLLIFAGSVGELDSAASHLLVFRWGDVTLAGLQLALTHAFYTLGLGMGVWVIFGAYMPAVAPLKRSVFAVALMDTLIALMAGLMLVSLIGVGGAQGMQGFGLIFLALPEALANQPWGQFVGTLCFLVVLLVAWTSALALFEPVIAWFQERFVAPRVTSVAIVAVAAWLVGLGTLFSFSIWAEATLWGGTFFRWIEVVTGSITIPLVSIMLALLVGWVLQREVSLMMIGRAPLFFQRLWYWVLRLVLPLAVFYIGTRYAVESAQSLCAGVGDAFWCAPELIQSHLEP